MTGVFGRLNIDFQEVFRMIITKELLRTITRKTVEFILNPLSISKEKLANLMLAPSRMVMIRQLMNC